MPYQQNISKSVKIGDPKIIIMKQIPCFILFDRFIIRLGSCLVPTTTQVFI